MLELRRLRLLHELHQRGTIAAVADALQFTPSAVSQQLALLEREVGVPLLERAGRGVRLTDPAFVLVEHAAALLERAERAEADLAAAAGEVAGRRRIATFLSAAVWIALPAIDDVEQSFPRLRCEVVEMEPEQALPALAVGDVDVVLGDEWQHQPWRMPSGLRRVKLLDDAVNVLLPATHVRAKGAAVALKSLADEPWVSAPPGLAWEELTQRTCRELGGFEPDIRHRAVDASLSLALVAAGHAVTMLPALATADRPEGVVQRPIAEGPVSRTIHAVTREADAARPASQALLSAIRAAAVKL